MELDLTLANLNVQARADLRTFTADLSLSVPEAKISELIVKLEPAEVYLSLEIARISEKPVDTVVGAYRRDRGAGLGAVATEMRIKPGSPAFHELKASADKRGDKAKDKGPKGR